MGEMGGIVDRASIVIGREYIAKQRVKLSRTRDYNHLTAKIWFVFQTASGSALREG